MEIPEDRKVIAKALSGKFKRGSGDDSQARLFIKAMLFNGKIDSKNAVLLENLILNGRY